MSRRNDALRAVYSARMESMPFQAKIDYVNDLRADLLWDRMTGLGTNHAFMVRREQKFVASLDVDSLKWLNDNLGHESGDQLLSNVGKALIAEGLKTRAFHISGDEFFVQSDSRSDLTKRLEGALNRLADMPITKGGITLPSPSFSYGIGENITEAELRLSEQKEFREAMGLRAGRGEVPPGVTGFVNEPTQKKPTHAEGFVEIGHGHHHFAAVMEEMSRKGSTGMSDYSIRDEKMREFFQRRLDSISPDELDSYIEELRQISSIDQKTGLRSNSAFMVRERHEDEYVAVADADSLKWVNDHMGGHEAGDDLLRKIASAIIGSGVDEKSAYRPSGDEFFVVGNDPQLMRSQLESAQRKLSEMVLVGGGLAYAGPSFSFGIAKTVEEADMLLIQNKQERERSGLRAGRGMQPADVYDVTQLHDQKVGAELSDLRVSEPFSKNDAPKAFTQSLHEPGL